MNKILIPLIITLGILCAYLCVQGAMVRGGAVKIDAHVPENDFRKCVDYCELMYK